MKFGFNPEKALANADKCVQQGKFPQAIELYEKVLPQQPTNLNLRNNLGDLYAKVGRNPDAIRLFLEVADQFEEQGMLPRVAAVLRKVLRLDPTSTAVQQRMAQCLIAQGIQSEARAILLTLAEKAEQSAEWKTAVSILAQVAALDADQPRSRVRLARARLRLGDQEQGQAELVAAAKALLEKKDWEGLEVALRELQALDPESVVYRLLQARSLLVQGKPEEAAAALPGPEAIADLKQEAPSLWRIACECGAYEQAMELGRAALRASYAVGGPVGQWFIEHALYDQALHWIHDQPELFRRGDLEPIWLELLQAINTADHLHVGALEAWLELVSEDRRSRRYVRLRLGPAYEHHGELEKAAGCYRALLDDEPGNPDFGRELHRLHELLGLVAPEESAAPAAALASRPPLEIVADSESAPAPAMVAAPSVAEFTIEPIAAEAEEPAMEEPTVVAAPDPAPVSPLPEPSVAASRPAQAHAEELDLTHEWHRAAESATSDLDERVREIEFYIANEMLEEADRALAKERHKHPDEPRLGQLSQQIFARRMSATAAAAPKPEPPKPELAKTDEEAPFTLGELAGAVEVEFLPSEAPPLAAPAPPPVPPQQSAAAAAGVAAASPRAGASSASVGGVLDDIFRDFQSALDAPEVDEKTDPEARYNLGVAYREMGLFEEAIAELQKAFAGWKARGAPAGRLLSCGATIALCFQDHHMPELALHWYQTTIEQGGLSPREALGPRFEAAKILEAMGRRDEALSYYRQVYAQDVDYHDVAECVRRLSR